jgi:hypothetical protein
MGKGYESLSTTLPTITTDDAGATYVSAQYSKERNMFEH